MSPRRHARAVGRSVGRSTEASTSLRRARIAVAPRKLNGSTSPLDSPAVDMNSRAWAEAPAAVTRVDPAAPAAGRVNNSKELRSGGQVAQLIQSTNNFSGPSAAAYKRWKMTGQLPEEVVQERTFGRTTAASNRAADSFRALDEAARDLHARQPLKPAGGGGDEARQGAAALPPERGTERGGAVEGAERAFTREARIARRATRRRQRAGGRRHGGEGDGGGRRRVSDGGRAVLAAGRRRRRRHHRSSGNCVSFSVVGSDGGGRGERGVRGEFGRRRGG